MCSFSFWGKGKQYVKRRCRAPACSVLLEVSHSLRVDAVLEVTPACLNTVGVFCVCPSVSGGVSP